MALDFSKPLMTREGGRVRILCKDRKCNNGYNIVALVDVDEGSREKVLRYNDAGRNISGIYKYQLVNQSTYAEPTVVSPRKAQSFDPGKQVRRRDGAPARIIFLHAEGLYPIIALAKINGEEIPHRYTSEGHYFKDTSKREYDLVNVPSFDPTKPVRTRDGCPARIVATDVAGHEYPIMALVTGATGRETAHCFRSDGTGLREALINI